VQRFWTGFAVSSALWAAAAAYLFFALGFRPPVAETELAGEPLEGDATAAVEPEIEAPTKRRRWRTRSPQGARTPQGLATTGDDLGEEGTRSIDMEGEGGEQQLTGAQIDAGFDGAMGRVRRCLVLMAGDDAVTGRVIFGLRIAPSGQVRAVQLSGPAAATTGEAGDCLSNAARSIRFPTFDGPEMVVRYPLTLE
jgi:hypothetical protein